MSLTTHLYFSLVTRNIFILRLTPTWPLKLDTFGFTSEVLFYGHLMFLRLGRLPMSEPLNENKGRILI